MPEQPWVTLVLWVPLYFPWSETPHFLEPGRDFWHLKGSPLRAERTFQCHSSGHITNCTSWIYLDQITSWILPCPNDKLDFTLPK